MRFGNRSSVLHDQINRFWNKSLYKIKVNIKHIVSSKKAWVLPLNIKEIESWTSKLQKW